MSIPKTRSGLSVASAVTAAAALAAVSAPRDAHALSCDEIMNMIEVNVPVNIVVQTMKDSGEVFTASDIQCLQNSSAPSEVVSAAKSMTAASEPAEEVRDTSSSGSGTDSRDVRLSEDEDDIIGGGRKSSKRTLEDDLPEEGGGPPDPRRSRKPSSDTRPSSR